MALLPNQPAIPAAEYPERWRRVQAMMAEHTLDLVIAYADDRATYGAAHARWPCSPTNAEVAHLWA